jgi:hypothetical protein
MIVAFCAVIAQRGSVDGINRGEAAARAALGRRNAAPGAFHAAPVDELAMMLGIWSR